MNCHVARSQMAAAGDETLDARRMADHFAHLRQCTSCREQWEALQRVEDLFRTAPLCSPQPGFTVRFQQRLARHRSTRWSPLSALFLALSALVVSGLVFLPVGGIVGLVWQVIRDPHSLDWLSRVVVDLIAGGRVAIHLVGTVVSLLFHYDWWILTIGYGLLAGLVVAMWLGAYSLRWRLGRQRSRI